MVHFQAISIKVSSELFESTIKFYEKLGFILIENDEQNRIANLHYFHNQELQQQQQEKVNLEQYNCSMGIDLQIKSNQESQDTQINSKSNKDNKDSLHLTVSGGSGGSGAGSLGTESYGGAPSSGSGSNSIVFSVIQSLPPQRPGYSSDLLQLNKGPNGGYLDPAGNEIVFAVEGRYSENKLISQQKQKQIPSTTGTGTGNMNAAENPTQSAQSGGSDSQNAENANPIPTPKRIAVLTSGGDSCGMNAAVRSITRVCLQRGCIPYAVYEGYQGLVDGGNKIKKLGWNDVRGYLSKGGTLIGTARCKSFRDRPGRLEGCFNLVKNGIDAIIIIGGDGSLTGADTFRREWQGLIDELVSLNRLTIEESKHLRSHLSIVGLVGSIDNDMSMTDITIGAVTSLHRICESVDSLVSTAQSHQRAFVVEVMGRHCGWLALMAAIAVGAEYVFIPERPPPLNGAKYGIDWENEMCDIVAKNRKNGSRKTLVIVCEGALDQNLVPIKPEVVKKVLETTSNLIKQKVLETRLGLDTRVTTLGHVQRGGMTCAFDRYLATVQGVAAVDAVLNCTVDSIAPMIGMCHNEIITVPLLVAVERTQLVSKAIAAKEFKSALELRDPDFRLSFDAYIQSSLFSLARQSSLVSPENRLRIGILHCGAPAGGMNAATRVFVRLCHSRGHIPLGIKNGFTGLVLDDIAPLAWEDVRGWQTIGGSRLGTNRDHPLPIPGITSQDRPGGVERFIDTRDIAYHLQKHNIGALVIIGGFEGYSAQLALTECRKLYPALCIPMVHIPATISNNTPGTDCSIGSDTALNVIIEACDSIRLSANASRKRVFVVEVHGGNCGYLASLSALTVGATSSYIPETRLSLTELNNDVKYLRKRYTEETDLGITNEGRVILRSQSAKPAVYSTTFISEMLQAEGKDLFDSRETVLGHLQQGDVPSPLDRIRATKLAVAAVDWIQATVISLHTETSLPAENENETSLPAEKQNVPFYSYTANPDHSCIIGIRGATIVATPVKKALAEEVDMEKRTTKNPWWFKLRSMIKVLGKREVK